MTEAEWLDKAEFEGLEYALTEYGLTEDDLDEMYHHGDLYLDIKEAREHLQAAQPALNRIKYWL